MWSLIPVIPAQAGIHCLCAPKRLEQVRMGPSARWDDGWRWRGLNHVVVDPRHSSASWNPLSVRAETFGASADGSQRSLGRRVEVASTGVRGRQSPSFQRKLESIVFACRNVWSKCRWVPAFAGTTGGGGIDWSARAQSPIAVIPAQAGIHCLCVPKRLEQCRWVPAFAGTTGGGGVDWITQSPIAVIPAQAGIHCLCVPKR